MRSFLAFILMLSVNAAFSQTLSDGKVLYDLSKPEKILQLPGELYEISGLTDISSTEIGCVQDELGYIYLISMEDGRINSKIPFSGNGDYEALTVVQDTVYVLRSDGVMIRKKDFRNDGKADEIRLDLMTQDNEGLAYDPVRKMLVIAGKSRVKADKEHKDLRYIYKYDLSQGILVPDHLVLDINRLIKYLKKNRIPIPVKETKTGNVREILRFLPSSIAVHPVTGNMYVLSATDQSLLVLASDGKFLGFTFLDHSLFQKPEGITFLQDGRMVISNEGNGKTPTLVLFNPLNGFTERK